MDADQDDNLAGPRGIFVALHIMAAAVFGGWFLIRLLDVLGA